ncbi:hypothetical protein L204_100410 [Cryptococcus depauperatus]|nr:hypothetical protein L204_02107 [Cryptococcus depauperatus CBS 7855]
MVPSQRPPWVVKDITKILMLDEETVSEMIVPEIEKQNVETRLRAHLQDFLGSSPQAKDFINRYLAYRFPSLTNTVSSIPNVTLVSDTRISEAKIKGKSFASVSASTSSTLKTSGAAVRGSSTNVENAFGPAGKVYKKNQEADDVSDQIGRSSSRQGSSATRPGSGSSTPVPRQRQAGSVSINVIEAKSRVTTEVKGKGKKAERVWDVPKSRQVQKIEGVIESLKTVQNEGPKPEQGNNCFCQARIHGLNQYTPLCNHCALVLCQLHAPHLPCPSCGKLLYSHTQLTRLIQQVERDLEEQLDKERLEELEKGREREERLIAESGGGAFPMLGDSVNAIGTGSNAVPVGNTRKVLTIGSNPKGKSKATLTTTTYRTASTVPSRSKTPPPEHTIPRPRSIPVDKSKIEKEIAKLKQWRKEEKRPWGNMKLEKKGQALKYVEADYIVMGQVNENHVGRRRKGKMKKDHEQRMIPGAA